MIYLDNAATTKPKKEVIETINKCLIENWGNPSSLYRIGVDAKRIVEESRETVANLIGAKPSEIIFTSGACEANSLAICGYLKKHHDINFFTTKIEHKSIINLKSDYTLPVNNNGFVNLQALDEILNFFTHDKDLVSIQFANNEIGTIQDIKNIEKIVHKYGGILHTDATQIIPDRKIDVKKLGIDMMSFSGQKLGAPKGIGVLYVKEGIELSPIIYGAQENSLRGGTENVPYIAGLKTAIDNLIYPTPKLRDYFVNKIVSEIDKCYLVGSGLVGNRLKNNASICFKGINSETLLIMLDQKDIYVSSGSACNSAEMKPSYVLEAINLPEEDLHSVVRFTFGEENTKEEVDIVVNELSNIIKILREL
jgi:cysteine desulfurase